MTPRQILRRVLTLENLLGTVVLLAFGAMVGAVFLVAWAGQ